jgi:hypothetical protein
VSCTLIRCKRRIPAANGLASAVFGPRLRGTQAAGSGIALSARSVSADE